MKNETTDGRNWIESTLVPGVFWSLVVLILLVFVSLSAFFVLIRQLVPLVKAIDGAGRA